MWCIGNVNGQKGGHHSGAALTLRTRASHPLFLLFSPLRFIISAHTEPGRLFRLSSFPFLPLTGQYTTPIRSCTHLNRLLHRSGTVQNNYRSEPNVQYKSFIRVLPVRNHYGFEAFAVTVNSLAFMLRTFSSRPGRPAVCETRATLFVSDVPELRRCASVGVGLRHPNGQTPIAELLLSTELFQ